MREGARNNAEAVRRNGVKFCYAENWIYAPPIEKMRRLIAASKGSILELRAEENHSGFKLSVFEGLEINREGYIVAHGRAIGGTSLTFGSDVEDQVDLTGRVDFQGFQDISDAELDPFFEPDGSEILLCTISFRAGAE